MKLLRHRIAESASRMVLAVFALLGSIVAASTAQAQTLTITTNASATVVPTIANLQSNSNTGTTLAAGSVTLSILNCKNNTTCTISILATSLPGGGTLNWSTTSSGATTKGSFSSCTAGTGAAVTTSAVPVLTCISTGNSDRSSIVVSFTYPVSWTGSTPGTFATPLKFRLTSN